MVVVMIHLLKCTEVHEHCLRTGGRLCGSDRTQSTETRCCEGQALIELELIMVQELIRHSYSSGGR